MLEKIRNNFFSIPRFLANNSFGVDISEESIKFVELVNTSKGIILSKYGERAIPIGVIESGKIKNLKKLEEILIALKKEEGIKSARVSLPEEQVYLFKLSIEKEGIEEVRDSIEFSLEENVPIPSQDVVFDYIVLKEDDKHLYVQVTAISKNVIESYISAFEDSGISASFFELETEAIVRAVIKRGENETCMVVDLGKKRTGISIFSESSLMFTSTIDVGGEVITNVIQKNFKISFEEAEKIKKRYGLGRDSEDKEMFSILLNVISVLRDEISRHLLFWNTKKVDENGGHSLVKKIILCGGDSNLLGLAEYLSASMKTEVEIANVWKNVNDIEKYIPEMNLEKSLSYATAIGLSLGDLKK